MDVIDRIKSHVATHPVCLFMRGTPEKPMCHQSLRAVRALREAGADFVTFDIQKDPELRAFLPKFSDQQGYPQLFLNGELIGGADIVGELAEQGELAAMVAQCQPPRAMAS